MGPARRPVRLPALAGAVLGLALPACSARQQAARSLGDLLSAGEAVFAREDDPDLAGAAVPFNLKAIETLLEEAPRDDGLLLAAASGFTRYAFAFVQQEADVVEGRDLARATFLRERAARLYLRGRDYGLRGIERDVPGFRDRLRQEPPLAVRALKREHVPLLYWTAWGWAGAISLRKSDSSLSGDQTLAEALMRRALELDEAFAKGAIHDFFIAYEAERAATSGSRARAREHFARARALARGQRAWPYLFLAESASVADQDRAEFERLLREALAIDVDRAMGERLSNLIAQRRARWLLSRMDELFVQ